MRPFGVILAACLTLTTSVAAVAFDLSETTATLGAADDTGPDEQAVKDLPQAWLTHYNAGDAASVAKLYADDAFYLSAHVLARGRQQIQAYWERGIAVGGHLDKVEPIFVSVVGSLGYFVGRYQATNAGVTVDGRLLIVVKKLDGVWRIVAHETVVRDQPE